MDVCSFSQMLLQLLDEAEKVEVPGLGSFVFEQMPASLSDRGFAINPPYRRLSFCQSSGEGDELARLYASLNGVGVEAAAGFISKYCAEIKSALVERGVLVLPGLGRLKTNAEGTIFFVEDPGLDLPDDSFGLTQVSMRSHSDAEDVLEDVILADISATELSITDVVSDDGSEQAVKEPVVESLEQSEKAASTTDNNHLDTADVHKKSGFWRAVAVALACCAAFLLLFSILSKLFPAFFDRILYTPEQLELLNMP